MTICRLRHGRVVSVAKQLSEALAQPASSAALVADLCNERVHVGDRVGPPRRFGGGSVARLDLRAHLHGRAEVVQQREL